ncbi:MAG: protein kinase, partial [Myxococcota bacterium]|nr:protein kinase [Myxococcota bacterium]
MTRVADKVGNYRLMELLGTGGFAQVFVGQHGTFGHTDAIKVLHPHLSASTRNRERFAREARAIEHLDHDNILTIFDYSG